MGLEFMKEPPFRDVYIHALVRDEHGQKMSKSKGNVIDPLVIIEKYGADALRLTLAALTLQGRDIFLSESRIETYRFFLNKLWNAARFALMNLEDAEHDIYAMDYDALRAHDLWIMTRVSSAVEEMTALSNGYFFGESARLMYDFVWGELCDWYLELSKPALRGEEGAARKRATQSVLYSVFRDVLKLLHPVIPFTTEELWSAFGYGDTIIGRSSWPTAREIPGGGSAASAMESIQAVVRAMRSLRAEIKMPPQQEAPRMCVRIKDPSRTDHAEKNDDLIRLLSRVNEIEFMPEGAPKPEKSISYITGSWEIFFPVGDLLDTDKEIARLRAESAKLAKEAERISGKLANKNFIDRAPAEVVEHDRAALADAESRIKRIDENIAGLL